MKNHRVRRDAWFEPEWKADRDAVVPDKAVGRDAAVQAAAELPGGELRDPEPRGLAVVADEGQVGPPDRRAAEQWAWRKAVRLSGFHQLQECQSQECLSHDYQLPDRWVYEHRVYGQRSVDRQLDGEDWDPAVAADPVRQTDAVAARSARRGARLGVLKVGVSEPEASRLAEPAALDAGSPRAARAVTVGVGRIESARVWYQSLV